MSSPRKSLRPPPLGIGHWTLDIPRRPRRGGFALLITITLLAFLVLLLVSLASLTRVETQVASNNQSIAQARQNALMALNLALGQLQRHAGPDQRVTARADVTIPSAVTVTASTTTTAALTSIDTHWRTRRNRQWTGVWLNANNDPADYDSDNPADFNPDPALQTWLVSGNENATDFLPETQLTGLSVTASPDTPLTDANGLTHRLLVSGRTTGATSDATDLDRLVTAPQQEIKSTGIPGTDGTATTVGHYAWWVGDEGIKARANLVDSYAAAVPGETAAEKLVRETSRRQSAQRPAIEAMTVTGTDGLAASYPANASDLLNVFTASQLTYLSPAASFPNELKTRFHDLSVTSRGILADTKHGGLKADLTYLFGQPNLIDFRTALNATYGTTDAAPAATSNRAFTPASTLYATLPADAGVAPRAYSGPTGIFSQSTTWEQLWSFANQGSSINPAGEALPRRQTDTQHGLYPLIIQTKVYYRLRIVGGTAVADPDGTMVNRSGVIHVETIPVILLANPYAVPLAESDYHVRISFGVGPALVFGNTDNTTAPSTEFTRAFTTEPSYVGNVRFILRSPRIEAGQALIFTIDPDPAANPGIDADDRLLLNNGSDARFVVMKNEFDPAPALALNTGRSIPSDKSRAAMWSIAGQLNTDLYLDYVAAEGDRRLVQFIRGQQYTGDLGLITGENRFLIVDPMSNNVRQGGGYNLVLNQPPITASPSTAGTPVSLIPMQAPFYQVNYRGLMVTFSGSDGSGLQHLVEWSRTFSKNGSTGSSGNTPNPWIAANLLRPSGSTTSARWGLVNLGQGSPATLIPDSIGGPSSTSTVGFVNHLYDIPRPGQPVSSLGQLQHLNTTGFIPVTNFDDGVHKYATAVNSWQVNYAVSNSYAHPRVPREQLFAFKNEHGLHFDGSYLWNDLLWDRFYFSTYPQAGDFDFDPDPTPATTPNKLVNSRYRPFRDRTTTRWDEEENFRGDDNPATAANARIAASNLIVEGAFNINSTSIEAWKAVFSSLKNVPVGTEASPAAPFSRILSPLGGSSDAKTGISPNSWHGFRDLTRDEIQSLAEEMVMQVRKRGPFLALSEFINRRLTLGRTSNAATSPDTFGLGLSGALQSAIDRVINQRNDLTAPFNVQAKAFVSLTTNNTSHNGMRDPDYRMSSALVGFPGYLLQADVLSALGPTLSARSDTFTIRTYGDSVNPATGDVTGRAWCEAVVQRLPDYVDTTPATSTPTAGSPAATFGRRFHITSFRWLSPEDI